MKAATVWLRLLTNLARSNERTSITKSFVDLVTPSMMMLATASRAKGPCCRVSDCGIEQPNLLAGCHGFPDLP